jgi:hypothetical protein
LAAFSFFGAAEVSPQIRTLRNITGLNIANSATASTYGNN